MPSVKSLKRITTTTNSSIRQKIQKLSLHLGACTRGKTNLLQTKSHTKNTLLEIEK